MAYTDGLGTVAAAAATVGLLVVVGDAPARVGSILVLRSGGLFVWYATLRVGRARHDRRGGAGLADAGPPVWAVASVLGELQHKLHPVSAFLVVPLFALANAGVDLRGGVLGDAAGSSVAWAVVIGLLVGKIAGIGGVTWLALRMGIGTLPQGMPPRLIWGVATLAGIGFTVSLFITDLAYSDAGSESLRRRSASSLPAWLQPFSAAGCCSH